MVGAKVHLTLPMWVVNTGYNLLLTALVTAYTTATLRRVMLREAAGGASAQEESSRGRKAGPPGGALATVADDDVAEKSEEAEVVAEPPAESSVEAARSRDVSDRPVLWREVRQATFGSRKWFKVILILAAVGIVWIYWWAGTFEGPFSLVRAMQNEGLHGTLMIIGAIVVMVQPVFMTTGSIANEREARTWDALLTTPLTGRQIVLGKFIGALRAQWFIPAIVLAHVFVAAATGFINPALAPLLLLTYLGPTLLFTATGQLLSLTFRRAVTAAACNLLLGLLLWLGTWIGLLLVAWFAKGGDGDWFDIALGGCYSLNPVAMSSTMLEGVTARARNWWMHDTFQVQGGRTYHLQTWGFSLVVLGVFAFYVLGAGAALLAAVRGFRRLSGRSS
jgi:ABC-type transport system involved in multi-copper enzyme maturation permease subunit